MANIESLLQQAAVIRDEVSEGENTALRVGSMFVDLVQAIMRALPPEMIDASVITYLAGESTFTVTFNSIDGEGRQRKRQIIIPPASKESAGLMTPEKLDDIAAVIKTAASAKSLAEQANTALENMVHPVEIRDTSSADLILADERENAIVTFKNGHIITANFDSSTIESKINSALSDIVHPIEIKDTSSADLILADGNENPIVTFKNGHIVTANFNSSTIESKIYAAAADAVNAAVGSLTPGATEKEPPLKGVRLSILGDSISTFTGHIPSGYLSFYPSGNVSSVDRTWWHQVIEATGMELLRNCSWSGSLLSGSESQAASETSAECGCSQRRVADLAASGVKPEVVIIFIGINDWGHASKQGYPLGTFDPAKSIPETNCFCGAYATVIKKVSTAYPSAKVYCCTLPTCTAKYASATTSSYPYLNGYGVPLALYNEAITNIAQTCGVNVIRLDQCGFTPWNDTIYTLDGLHPNLRGAGLIARKVINALINS